MIPSGGHVVVAVSGGLDSMVLMHALSQLRGSLDFCLVVGHVDHGLRGEASTQDAAFVRSAAENLELPCYCRTLVDTDFLPFRGLGGEGAARAVRRRALQEISDEAGARRIALAHTIEDRAETLLFNLTRGAGGRGFTAMPASHLPFIRPLLGIHRTAVLAYARERGILWREDSSNADISISRNRIRHRVLPELRHINPRADEAICRAAKSLGDLSEAAEALALDWVSARISVPDTSTIVLDLRGVGELPESAQRLALRASIQRARGSLLGITATHVEAVRTLVECGRAHGTCSLPELTVRLSQGTLRFHRDAPGPVVFAPMAIDLGATEIPELGVRVHLEIATGENGRSAAAGREDVRTHALDADALTLPLQLRTRRPGDRFRPLGLDEPMKLKSFLINERVPFFDRDCVPLLCNEDRIICVAGIRISDTVKITEKTTRVLHIRVEESAC